MYWALYSLVCILVYTLSPFEFKPNQVTEFSWKYNLRDILQNILLMLPLGFFGVLSSKRFKPKNLITYFIFGILLSSLIESIQLTIGDRYSQYWDIICNSVGLLIGAITASLLQKKIFAHMTILNEDTFFLINILFLNGIIIKTIQLQTLDEYPTIIRLFMLGSAGVIALAYYHSKKIRTWELIGKSFIFSAGYYSLLTTPYFFINPRHAFSEVIFFAIASSFLIFILSCNRNIKISAPKILATLGLTYIPILVYSLFISLNIGGSPWLLNNLTLTDISGRELGIYIMLILTVLLTFILVFHYGYLTITKLRNNNL